jgi:hypothetical protein
MSDRSTETHEMRSLVWKWCLAILIGSAWGAASPPSHGAAREARPAQAAPSR